MRHRLGAVGEGLFELGVDEDAHSPEVRRGLGGDAANAAVMAARLGVPARLCGRVGADALGRLLLQLWREAGVDVEHVRIDDGGPTGIYVNERLRSGGHAFHYHRRLSAGSRLEPADVTPAFLAGLDILLSTGITLAISASARDAAAEATERARRAGAAVAFAVNHRPALGGDPECLLEAARAADVVFASLEDLEHLLGATSPGEGVAALAGRAREVVITDGGRGAGVDMGGGLVWLAAPSVDVVDAAGAGDALAGAYLASRLQGRDPVAALERGVAAAALSCESIGAALSYPNESAVDALVRRGVRRP
jgi:2-dehydro-3-deoxygluconokinase